MRGNFLFITFLSTNYGALKKHWQKFSVLKKHGKKGSDRPFKGELGGKISLVDWDKKKIIWEKNLKSASGMIYKNRIIYVNSINLGKIIILKFPEGRIIGEINHPLLNKPHGLVKTKRGFLVASTGLDTIVEINQKGMELYKIFLTDHGYPNDQFGNIRKIDKTINHQTIVYPSLNQTTHVNFARYENSKEDKILATLFHPGEVVRISKRTNKVTVLLKGLKQPHNIKDFSKNSYLVCDTGNNKVLEIYKKTFKKGSEIVGPFSWVQDASKVGRFLYLADADNHRVVKVDLKNSGKMEFLNFSKNDRIYQILPLTKI